jgi:hypothetical protein
METNVSAGEKYGDLAVFLILLFINAGCVFLFYMIAGNVERSEFERTALNQVLQYASWSAAGLFLLAQLATKNLHLSRSVTTAITMLNIFTVLGGIVSSIPFRLTT